MIRVAVMYPRTEGKSFDLEYYKNTHMKLVKEKLGPFGLIASEVDSAVAGMDDSPSPYVTIGYIIFDTLDQFQTGFAKVGGELIADIPNYTEIEPVIQVSEYHKL
jgi:uncharacterized protein (TIGR02118 family)